MIRFTYMPELKWLVISAALSAAAVDAPSAAEAVGRFAADGIAASPAAGFVFCSGLPKIICGLLERSIPFAETRLDEGGQGVDDFRRLLAGRFDGDRGAGRRREHHQAHD